MATARKSRRKASSKCSKRRPCHLKIGGRYLPAEVKTYAKYGKPEFVLTGLPADVKVIPGSKRMVSSIGGKAHRAAMKKRAAIAARKLASVSKFEDAQFARKTAKRAKRAARRGSGGAGDAGWGKLGDGQR